MLLFIGIIEHPCIAVVTFYTKFSFIKHFISSDDSVYSGVTLLIDNRCGFYSKRLKDVLSCIQIAVGEVVINRVIVLRDDSLSDKLRSSFRLDRSYPPAVKVRLTCCIDLNSKGTSQY